MDKKLDVMFNSSELVTVGDLMNAIAGLPDDTFVSCQIVSGDGKLWLVRGNITVKRDGTVVIGFSHDELTTLIRPEDRCVCPNCETKTMECIVCGFKEIKE